MVKHNDRYGQDNTDRQVGWLRKWVVMERDSVRLGDKTIEYEVRRSRRRKKTVQITVDAGIVRVASPTKASATELQDIVRKRASWILRHSSPAMPKPAPQCFVSGETLPYLGRNVPIIVEPADISSPEVYFDNLHLRIAAPSGLDDADRGEQVRKVVIDWYRTQAAERFPADVDRWWPKFGTGAKPRILIRNQLRRWGSCAHDGTLRFNWRAMMLETVLVEYIVVHELAHLTIRNHSPDFWALVSGAVPDVQQRRGRLREAGRTLPP